MDVPFHVIPWNDGSSKRTKIWMSALFSRVSISPLDSSRWKFLFTLNQPAYSKILLHQDVWSSFDVAKPRRSLGNVWMYTQSAKLVEKGQVDQTAHKPSWGKDKIRWFQRWQGVISKWVKDLRGNKSWKKCYEMSTSWRKKQNAACNVPLLVVLTVLGCIEHS